MSDNEVLDHPSPWFPYGDDNTADVATDDEVRAMFMLGIARIDWDQPEMVMTHDAISHYGCRLCIARHSFDPANVKYFPQTLEEFEQHRREHHASSKISAEKQAALENQVRKLEEALEGAAGLVGEFHQMNHALDAKPDTYAECEFNVDEVAIIGFALRNLMQSFNPQPNSTHDTQTPT